MPTLTPVGVELALEGPYRVLGEGHDLHQGLDGQFFEIGDVGVGSDHQVTVVVGEGVEQDEGTLAPPHDVVLAVVGRCALGAE